MQGGGAARDGDHVAHAVEVGERVLEALDARARAVPALGEDGKRGLDVVLGHDHVGERDDVRRRALGGAFRSAAFGGATAGIARLALQPREHDRAAQLVGAVVEADGLDVVGVGVAGVTRPRA